MARKSKYTKEILEPLVKKHKNLAGVLRDLGLCPTGGNHCLIKTRIKVLKISWPHFTGVRQFGKDNPMFRKRKPLKEILVKDSSYSNYNLKKRILRNKLIPYVCMNCGLLPTWNGKKLVLQLDHANGNRRDHRLKNLRFLCPNCHSQTKTFSRPNSN